MTMVRWRKNSRGDVRVVDYANLPTLTSFQARDGNDLFYRYYPVKGQTDKIMVAMHGICEDSKYMAPLARFVSENGLAHVYTPDLRGYGEKSSCRGDLDYIGQLEDDLADFITIIKKEHPNASIILAGHSAGGGTAIRFAASKYANVVDRFLLLAPFVHFQAPIMKGSDVSAAHKGRLITLMILNGFGYRGKNHLTVLESTKPKDQRHGSETLALSYRLFMSRLPDKYKKALTSIPDDTLVLIGNEDEVFEASAYKPLFEKYRKYDVHVIDEVDHDGILSSEEAFVKIENWLMDE